MEVQMSKWNLFWLELFIWWTLVLSNVLTRQTFSRSTSTTSPLDFFNLGASQATCIHHSYIYKYIYMTWLNGVGEHGKLESGKGSGPEKTGGAWGTEDGHTVTVVLCVCTVQCKLDNGSHWQGQKVQKVEKVKVEKEVEKVEKPKRKAAKATKPSPKDPEIAQNSQVVRWVEAWSLALFKDPLAMFSCNLPILFLFSFFQTLDSIDTGQGRWTAHDLRWFADFSTWGPGATASWANQGGFQRRLVNIHKDHNCISINFIILDDIGRNACPPGKLFPLQFATLFARAGFLGVGWSSERGDEEALSPEEKEKRRLGMGKQRSYITIQWLVIRMLKTMYHYISECKHESGLSTAASVYTGRHSGFLNPFKTIQAQLDVLDYSRF